MSLVFITIFLLISAISAESLVTTIVGGLISLGVTQWIKNDGALQGPAVTLMAFFVAVVVGFIAFVVSAALSSEANPSWSLIAQNSAQIFALSTLAYNLFLKDRSV